VDNGDFENRNLGDSDLSPWAFERSEPETSDYGLSGPGAEGSCTAFYVSLTGVSGSNEPTFELYSPPYGVERGRRYQLSFLMRFAHRNTARLDVRFNSGSNTTTALQNPPPVIAWAVGLAWTRIQADYTSDVGWVSLGFLCDLAGADTNDFWIDRVQLAPVPLLSAATSAATDTGSSSTVSAGVSGAIITTAAASQATSTNFTLSVLDTTPTESSAAQGTTLGSVISSPAS
jgi:hypothetical protein